jgi:hypothetical protein
VRSGRRWYSGTHNVGMFCDGSPEQRGGVDEMVQGRGVPNLPKLSPKLQEADQLSQEARTENSRGMRMGQDVISPPCTRGSWGGTCARRRCRVPERRPLLNSTAHPGGLTKETGSGGGGEGEEQDGLPETAATLCHSIGSVGATILFSGWSPRTLACFCSLLLPRRSSRWSPAVQSFRVRQFRDYS